MEAGKLRHRVVIEARGPAQDAYGEQATDWNTETGWVAVATVWAAFHAEGGREFHEKGEVLGEAVTIITTRYVAGVKPEQRVAYTWGGVTRYFSIRKVFNVEERNRTLELHTVEYVQGG
jgi:head-tail adaptor